MLGLGGIARKLLGSSNDRLVRRHRSQIEAIAALEDDYSKLSDAEIRGKTAEFKAQLASGKTVNDLLVPAFALVREASKRTLGMRHFDVQMVGGIVLHRG